MWTKLTELDLGHHSLDRSLINILVRLDDLPRSQIERLLLDNYDDWHEVGAAPNRIHSKLAMHASPVYVNENFTNAGP